MAEFVDRNAYNSIAGKVPVKAPHTPDSPPATPDFDDYPWVPLRQVSLADDFAIVRWEDGRELHCYSMWLAENTYGIEPRSRESKLDPRNLPAPGSLIKAVRTDAGALAVAWASGESVEVHPGWLRHVAEQAHTPEARLPPITRWDRSTFTEPPTFDGASVLRDESVFRAWLNALCELGIARLRDAPTTEAFMEEVGRRIGPIRGSNFGAVFDVVTKVDPDSTANTSLPLPQHTDLPTRETPPGFQFLHCITNTVPGGESRMTDGLAVIDELERAHPEHFTALRTLQWTFANRSPDDDHRWTGPIIDQPDPDGPLTIRGFHPVRAFPAMAAADVPRAYAALRCYAGIAHDDRFQITYRLEPGDLVGFDNRRVLHGRNEFDDGAGHRHLRGCYLDQDDVYSRLRVLNRRV